MESSYSVDSEDQANALADYLNKFLALKSPVTVTQTATGWQVSAPFHRFFQATCEAFVSGNHKKL